MEQTNLQATLVTFMERIWNSGNFNQIEDYVAAEYKIKHDPGDDWDGKTLDIGTFIRRVKYSRDAFPDIRFDIQEMISSDNRVAAAWIMSGTHQGDLPQLPATGKQFVISGMTFYYFRDNKVCGHWQSFDRLGFLAQIGFLGS